MIRFKEAFALQNKVGRYARGGETIKKYFYLDFSHKALYQFLLEIGLTPAKSKTIQGVNVPDLFFAVS